MLLTFANKNSKRKSPLKLSIFCGVLVLFLPCGKKKKKIERKLKSALLLPIPSKYYY